MVNHSPPFNYGTRHAIFWLLLISAGLHLGLFALINVPVKPAGASAPTSVSINLTAAARVAIEAAPSENDAAKNSGLNSEQSTDTAAAKPAENSLTKEAEIRHEKSETTLAKTSVKAVTPRNNATDVEPVTQQALNSGSTKPIQPAVKEVAQFVESTEQEQPKQSEVIQKETLESPETIADSELEEFNSASNTPELKTEAKPSSIDSNQNTVTPETLTVPQARPTQSHQFGSAAFRGAVPKVIKPALAKKKRLKGTVILRGLVSETGVFTQIEIYQSSGYRILDESAAEQAAGWSFQPAMQLLTPVTQWVQIPIVFQ